MKIVTGIGSREVSVKYQEILKEVADYLAITNFKLRSGGAPGSDTIFQNVFKHKKAAMEIYIPWNGFEKLFANNKTIFLANHNICEEFTMKYHPNADNLSQGAFKLMNRNAHQVLGMDLETPTDLIVCYTEGGKIKGGTSQAIRIAMDYNIPIVNVGSENSADSVIKKIENILFD